MLPHATLPITLLAFALLCGCDGRNPPTSTTKATAQAAPPTDNDLAVEAFNQPVTDLKRDLARDNNNLYLATYWPEYKVVKINYSFFHLDEEWYNAVLETGDDSRSFGIKDIQATLYAQRAEKTQALTVQDLARYDDWRIERWNDKHCVVQLDEEFVHLEPDLYRVVRELHPQTNNWAPRLSCFLVIQTLYEKQSRRELLEVLLKQLDDATLKPKEAVENPDPIPAEKPVSDPENENK